MHSRSSLPLQDLFGVQHQPLHETIVGIKLQAGFRDQQSVFKSSLGIEQVNETSDCFRTVRTKRESLTKGKIRRV